MSGRVWSPYAHLPFKLEPGLKSLVEPLKVLQELGRKIYLYIDISRYLGFPINGAEIYYIAYTQ